MVVDYIEMRKYAEANLDDDPVIVPKCGHATLVSSLDGNLEMTSVYDINQDGTITGIKSVDPFSGSLKEFPGCPICRGSLRGINRYGRLVRRVLLDESTKRFVTSAGSANGALSERLYNAFEQLQNGSEAGLRTTFSVALNLELRGSRDEQFRIISAITHSLARYTEMKAVRRALSKHYNAVHKDSTPFAKVWNLVEAARRRNGSARTVELGSPVFQLTFHIIALALLIRCDIALLSDLVDQFQKTTKDLRAHCKLTVDLAKNREDCEYLLVEALDSKDYERAVEAHIFYAR